MAAGRHAEWLLSQLACAPELGGAARLFDDLLLVRSDGERATRLGAPGNAVDERLDEAGWTAFEAKSIRSASDSGRWRLRCDRGSTLVPPFALLNSSHIHIVWTVSDSDTFRVSETDRTGNRESVTIVHGSRPSR